MVHYLTLLPSLNHLNETMRCQVFRKVKKNDAKRKETNDSYRNLLLKSRKMSNSF